MNETPCHLGIIKLGRTARHVYICSTTGQFDSRTACSQLTLWLLAADPQAQRTNVPLRWESVCDRRGYYKCSSMKGCMARKLVERSPAKPGVLIVTYMAEHCHPVPTQLNALAGTTRHKTSSSGAAAEHSTASSPKRHEQGQAVEKGTGDREHGNNETSTMAGEFGGEEVAAVDDDNEFWPAGMDLDELLAPVDDDFDVEHVMEEEDGVLGRRLSL